MRQVVTYIRVSTAQQGRSGLGIEAQREALARARSREAGLAYELVAARADLQAIVDAWRHDRPEPEVRTLTGWRRELVGAELLELLEGRLTLSVDPQRHLHIAG